MDSSTANLSKMKVADLKKELKNRDLSITGNKTELVERLQEALTTIALKKKSGGSKLDTSAADDEEFDEEELLGEGEDDDTNVNDQQEAAILSGNMKKVGDPKKALKRPAPATNGDNKENGIEESDAKVAKVDDPLKARSERFGVITSEVSKKESRAERFGDSLDSKSPSSIKPDITKLKSRAERFGEVTAKSLTSLEVDEKKKARMERFGIIEEKKVDTDAAKKSRADRFGAVTPADDDLAKIEIKRTEKPTTPVKVATPETPKSADTPKIAAMKGTPKVAIGTPKGILKAAVGTPKSTKKPVTF